LSRTFPCVFLRICGVAAAIEPLAAQARFRPPYRPDFDPTELASAKLKAFLRATHPRTFAQVCDLIAAALGLFTSANYARCCG